MTVAVIAAAGCTFLEPASSERGSVGREAFPQRQNLGEIDRPRSERCRSARTAAVYYRLRTHTWQALRGGKLASMSPVVAGKSCHWAKFAAGEWKARASSARKSYARWLERYTLRETDSWQEAIQIVQVVFPGTASWMDSCSDAEGMEPSLDRTFYVFGHKPFSWEAWYADTVGGPGQIRPSTYKGMYLSGLAYVLERGYRVPRHLHQANAYTWQSMLTQAIAMGWARYTGNDNWHWKASWGHGC